MKILVLCRTLPMPLTTGARIRSFHILKGLAKHNEISLVSLVHQDNDMQYIKDLECICNRVYPIRCNLSKKMSAFRTIFSSQPWDSIAFYSREAKSKIRELIISQNFDIVWINFLSMSNYLDPDMVSKSLFILDQHNADELVWKNYSKLSNNLAMRYFAAINLQKLKSFQREMMEYFSAVACVSKDDVEYMRECIPENVNTWLVPNGVDTEYFVPKSGNQKQNNIIMLCASMDVTMNIDAALRFARESFPRIKTEIPDSEFWIVGRDPPKQIRELAREGYIKVTGSVEDVRPYYNKAKIVVAPYLFGGGTKLKILEAMAMNIPIVSTSIGCRGIDITSDTRIIIQDNMKEFGEAVSKSLRSEGVDSTMRQNNSRKVIEDKYSWTSIVENLEPKLLDLLNHRLQR
jgi:polysaccharide biosynthesis protein PslH